MERLTWECELDGFADIGLRDGVTIDTAICRLSAYERTGLEPEEIDEIFDEYNAILKAIIKDGERMISIDRLHELAQADREGRCVVQEFAPGDEVWVVERDEDGNASEVSGFIFVASVNGVAIVSPSINDCSDIDFILSDFVEETATEFSGSLSGYPIFDCYKSRGEAKAALKAREQE